VIITINYWYSCLEFRAIMGHVALVDLVSIRDKFFERVESILIDNTQQLQFD